MTLIAVPFVPQFGRGANRYQDDCAIACLVMVLGWAKLKPPTVDSLAAETSLRLSDTGLGAEQVAMLATAHGLPMLVRRGVDVSVLRWEIDHKRPCVVAVNEWKISRRPGEPTGDGAHDLVCVGYIGSMFYAHDPNGFPNLPVAASELASAMHPRGDTVIIVASADAPPVTRPAARLGTTTANLNVRAQPTTASRIIATLKKETRILVIEDAPGWLRIAGGIYKDKYVSADYVSF